MVTLSGITPSGSLTLGNYLGALRRFGDDPGGFYFVADLHAMTTAHDPRRLAALVRETATLFLAQGLGPGTVFVQSHVPAHAQLGYLLECTAYTGELSRMIQFKQKSVRAGGASVRASLFTYPCLMAADILLYRADQVPVGSDQDQHVELARRIAGRFNHEYGPTFVVPRLVHGAAAVHVRDLRDPAAKMDKSAPSQAPGVIRILDSPDVVRAKVARAVTDSGSEVAYDPQGKPGVANLLDILAACTGASPQWLAASCGSYRELKDQVADAVDAVLAGIQQRYAELAADPAQVDSALAAGAARAARAAQPVLDAARAAMGLSVPPVPALAG